MNNPNNRSMSNSFFIDFVAEPIFAEPSFERIVCEFKEAFSGIQDYHAEHSICFFYFQVMMDPSTGMCSFPIHGTNQQLLTNNSLGTLLSVFNAGHQYTVWLPCSPQTLRFDGDGRIDAGSQSTATFQLQLHPLIQLSVERPTHSDEVVVFPCVVMEDSDGQFFDGLRILTEVELRCYRKSNWFYTRQPADLWKYLINGSVYDSRAHESVGKRFKCQQCAYSWYSYLDYLYRETGKNIYAVLRDEVAYSVLLDMSDDGEWRHGFWSDDMETHARFHLDGIHLLLSQYEKTKDSLWREAGERGMTFVLEHLSEALNDGSLWFLHDTIEHTMPHQFRSTLFGKSPGNSLCINTHVQALTVLHRLREAVPDNEIYRSAFDQGMQALRRVLEHQPASWLYRVLVFIVLKAKIKKPPKSVLKKVGIRFGQYVVRKFFWFVRTLFPRIVYPNGFVERDLTLSWASDRYHIINIKDLLTLYQQEPVAWLPPYIENGVAFARQLDLAQALGRSPYYIEWMDILYLYNLLIAPIEASEFEAAMKTIEAETEGYSLDYYASELVRGV